MADLINKPPHYVREDGREVIEVIAEFLGSKEAMFGYCMGNIVKYTERAGKKKGETAATAFRKAEKYCEFAERFCSDMIQDGEIYGLIQFVRDTASDYRKK